MNAEFSNTQDKSAGELGREAFTYVAHVFLAVLFLAIVVVGGVVMRISMDDVQPKILGTILAFFVPLVGGFIVAKSRQQRVAGYVWLAGLVTFAIVSVWVLDLPTGQGLCEKCGAIEKLSRTFFEPQHGSGLMGGDGLLVGCWIPLSMIGYSLGAKMGLD
jgi:hypothetical protein